ncbi:hypothetical protein ACSSS7_007137 [Eimeria intestinalis]
MGGSSSKSNCNRSSNGSSISSSNSSSSSSSIRNYLALSSILSNSSIQQTPPSAKTTAPLSRTNSRVSGSRDTATVRPTALLPRPEV